MLIGWCLYIYIYIYVCVCVCVCIYIYIYTHTQTQKENEDFHWRATRLCQPNGPYTRTFAWVLRVVTEFPALQARTSHFMRVSPDTMHSRVGWHTWQERRQQNFHTGCTTPMITKVKMQQAPWTSTLQADRFHRFPNAYKVKAFSVE
jgi:hypothetical protein